jgi:hypothetical protein
MTGTDDLLRARGDLDKEFAELSRLIGEMRKHVDRMRLAKYKSWQVPHKRRLRKAAHALQRSMERIGDISSLLRFGALAAWVKRNKLGLVKVYDLRSDPSSINSEVEKLEHEREKLEKIIKSAPLFSGGWVLMPGQYEAFNILRQLIHSAKSRFYLVDPWIDNTVFADYLEGIRAGTEIRVLSCNLKGDFVARARKFRQERPTFDVRRSNAIHDRYLVVDDRAWILGPSLKDAGSKAWVIVEFADVATMEKMIQELWGKSTPLV